VNRHERRALSVLARQSALTGVDVIDAIVTVASSGDKYAAAVKAHVADPSIPRRTMSFAAWVLEHRRGCPARDCSGEWAVNAYAAHGNKPTVLHVHTRDGDCLGNAVSWDEDHCALCKRHLVHLRAKKGPAS